MRIIVIVLLFFGAHFSMTANLPTLAGKAWLMWPFAVDSKPLLKLSKPLLGTITRLLSALAAAGFIAALLSLLGWLVPASWCVPLTVFSSVASFLLYVLYFGRWAVLPILIDLVLLWGVFSQGWTPASLGGG